MATRALHIDPVQPDPSVISEAKTILEAGGLVAFPTETVYGLGANALDAVAVRKIFEAKGRPANNPVIVHVANLEAAADLVGDVSETAMTLAARFWPGPLTLVLAKSDRVPSEVTAGGPTVAIRVPAHPVALALLEACPFPIAAPSANRSNELSPTRGEHVLRSLDGRVDLLLDGGPVTGGLESTVLDVTANPPRLLRPGLISPAQMEEIIGPIHRLAAMSPGNEALPSPGMMAKHYSPRTPLECIAGSAKRRVDELIIQGLRVGWIQWGSQTTEMPAKVMPHDPESYAQRLFAVLHEFDVRGLDRIVLELPPTGDAWLAIHDRLRRASG